CPVEVLPIPKTVKSHVLHINDLISIDAIRIHIPPESSVVPVKDRKAFDVVYPVSIVVYAPIQHLPPGDVIHNAVSIEGVGKDHQVGLVVIYFIDHLVLRGFRWGLIAYGGLYDPPAQKTED